MFHVLRALAITESTLGRKGRITQHLIVSKNEMGTTTVL